MRSAGGKATSGADALHAAFPRTSESGGRSERRRDRSCPRRARSAGSTWGPRASPSAVAEDQASIAARKRASSRSKRRRARRGVVGRRASEHARRRRGAGAPRVKRKASGRRRRRGRCATEGSSGAPLEGLDRGKSSGVSYPPDASGLLAYPAGAGFLPSSEIVIHPTPR
jgi:hypothetical protein